AAVTYILMPGETRVRMIYTFYNPNSVPMQTLWGSISDTGAGPEIFHPGRGFGELSFSDIASTSGRASVPYVSFLGRGLAYGVVPIFADPTIGSQSVPVAGVDVEVYQIADLFDGFSDNGQSLKLKAGGTDSREVDLIVGRDVGDVTAQSLMLRGIPTAPIA